MSDKEDCPICLRSVKNIDITYHHYLPKCEGGKLKDTIRICRTCHETLHYCIPIEETKNFKTVDLLVTHPVYKLYIEWIRTKNSQSMYKVRNIVSKYLPELKKLRRKYKIFGIDFTISDNQAS